MGSSTRLSLLLDHRLKAWPCQPSSTRTTGWFGCARERDEAKIVYTRCFCSPHSDEERHEAIPLDLVLDELPQGKLVPVNRRHGIAALSPSSASTSSFAGPNVQYKCWSPSPKKYGWVGDGDRGGKAFHFFFFANPSRQ